MTSTLMFLFASTASKCSCRVAMSSSCMRLCSFGLFRRIDAIGPFNCKMGSPLETGKADAKRRSEEHTSELQSLMRISYAVFCLKKKKTNLQYKTSTELTYRPHI